MTLPAIPPIPDINDPLFNALMAVRNSIQALYRDAAMNDQTAQMAANALEVHASTAALQAATAATQVSDGDRWWEVMRAQIIADNHGPDVSNTIRNKYGIGWMASQADAALTAFKSRNFP